MRKIFLVVNRPFILFCYGNIESRIIVLGLFSWEDVPDPFLEP